MYKFLLLLFVFAQTTLYAQEYSKTFGKIGNEEIGMANYPGDETAEAVVLFDIGKSHFVESDNSFNVVFERATRIKILSEAGLKWAEIEVPFYREGDIFEKIYDIEAYTYNVNENNGLEKIAFNNSNTYDEKINESWYYKKFALPSVKPGSIIEYRYKLVSQYKFNLRDWEFQRTIPTVYSEYQVSMIPIYEYKWLIQGTSKLDVYESYQDKNVIRRFGAGAYGENEYHDMVYKFGMKNVPAFKDESFITSINDYITKLDFQLAKVHHLNGVTLDIITTWPDLVKGLLKDSDFGRFLKKSENMAPKLLEGVDYSQKKPKEKYEDIIQYVKTNYSWNKISNKYPTKTVKEFVEDKYGNSADINLFAIGLLNAVGVEAYPVLISTRNHGKIRYDYPFHQFFNYVVIYAKVGNEIFLTDATELLCPNDMLPLRCINDKGLIVNKENVEWISLDNQGASKGHTIINLDLEGAKMMAKVKSSYTGQLAMSKRGQIGENKEVLGKGLMDRGYEIIEDSTQIYNYLTLDKPFTIEFASNHTIEEVNGKMYISPFLNEVISENPLKQLTRINPIDMVFPEKKSYFVTIIIPKGYKIEVLPKDVLMRNALFDIEYRVTNNNDMISISFVYFFKHSVYPANAYPILKAYFEQIIKVGNSKVVLSKGQ